VSDSPAMISAPRVCPKCGSEIPADAPEEGCPGCLLENGLGLQGYGSVTVRDSAAAAEAWANADVVADARQRKKAARAAEMLGELGDYELLEEVGRGGQGVVFRARQKSLNRTVALKVITLGRWASKTHLKRFRLEAEAAARLEHPGIVPIHEVGERDGSCYFSMKFVEGGQLDQVVRRTPMSLRQAAELIAKVARTVHYAHEHGILHRDIKPGNILLDEKGEPHLTDFGLARLVESESTMTRTLEVMGTPSYMAPEQAAGNNAAISSVTDVYGLGAVLYQLLTGQPPFAGGTTYETIKLVLDNEPRQPRQLNPKVDRDLSTICLKCLEKDPKRRYSSALALAEDLERWLKHEPVQARRTGVFARGKKWVRRNPSTAALITLLAALAAGSGVVVWNRVFAVPMPKSVAVLPFQNLSQDSDNAYFADGIQDDLLTSLARIKDLKVVSRSSVASYRDLSGRKLRAIAQELGVRTVLEGSVRRTANRVLVNVQLTDATTEQQIWSDRYDRTLQDSISLQGELAAEIATALAAKVSPEEKAQVEAKLTNNPDAYVVYLRGREFQMRPEVSRDNFVAAEQCYRHAVALDPRFAIAHARLAEILEGRYGWFDHQPALLAEARSHAEEALRLDPHCGQAHMEMAIILSYSVKSTERDKAIKEKVDSALRLVPNDGYLVMIAALLQTDMDWLEEAEATFQRAIEINPREPKVFYNYFTLLTKKGDVAKARWASDRSLELAPESVYFRLNRAEEEFLWTGEVARTKKFLAEIPAGKDPDGRVTAAHCTVALYERNFSEALRLLAACPSERLPSFVCRFGNMVPKGFLEGWIHFYAGNKERAYTALDSARWILEMEAKEDLGDQGAHFAVAMAYAAMGWKDAALAEIARTKEKPNAWPMAVLLVHAGQRDAALRLLEQLPATERDYWYYDLRLNPHWDPLRSDARFEKMLGSSPKTAAVPDT